MNDTNGTDDIVCREDFIKTDLICEPRCDSFEQSSHSDTLIMIYSEVVATSMGLIFCVVAIIVAVKEYKTLLVTYKVFLHNFASLQAGISFCIGIFSSHRHDCIG